MPTLASLLLAASLQLSPAPALATERVQALYNAFPFGDTSVVTADRSELSQYFDAELIALLDADLECSRRHEAICNLNGDPLYNAQDAQIENLQVSAGASDELVQVRFDNFGEPQQLVLRMRRTAAGWRVQDIEYGEDQSLRGWLTTPIP